MRIEQVVQPEPKLPEGLKNSIQIQFNRWGKDCMFALTTSNAKKNRNRMRGALHALPHRRQVELNRVSH